jgi:hypothetical protein
MNNASKAELLAPPRPRRAVSWSGVLARPAYQPRDRGASFNGSVLVSGSLPYNRTRFLPVELVLVGGLAHVCANYIRAFYLPKE